MRVRYYLCRLLAISTLLVSQMPVLQVRAAADTCTWTGAGSDANFTTAANWTGCDNGTVPESGDALVFDTGVANQVANNDLVGATFTSLSFTGSTGIEFVVQGNAITLSGGITSSHTNGAVKLDVDLTLSASQTFNVTDGTGFLDIGDFNTTKTLDLGANQLTLAGSLDTFGSVNSVVSGGGSIVKSGAGLWVLNGDNTFTGSVAVNQGYLSTSSTTGLGTAASGTTVSDTASLSFGSVDVAEVTINEPLTLSGGGVSTLSPGVLSADSVCLGEGCITTDNFIFAGPVTLGSSVKVDTNKKITITGALSGAYTIGLVSGSSGQLVINSSNNTSLTPNGSLVSPTETITIADGDSQPGTDITIGTNQTYVINGTRGLVTVGPGGTLKGKGTVGSIVASGTVAPGESPGCLTSGNLTLSGTLQVEIAGTTVCTEYDQQIVNGTVDITGASLSVTFLNGFTGTNGNQFIIISNDGSDPVTGEFVGAADGATVTLGGAQFVIDYQGGDGNDVVLTLQVPAVPNTGFRLQLNNPVLILSATLLATILLGLAARKTY